MKLRLRSVRPGWVGPVLGLPGLVLMASGAMAETQTQQTHQPPTHPHPTHQEQETLTVTANRVEESWLESAETITLLSSEDIQERNIKNVAQLVEQIPGVTLYENYSGVIDINYRGNNSAVFEGSSPIVVYVDGIPLSNRNGIAFDMNDVELVEAVRGPAGAIYGKNNIGGVINIKTRRPQQETSFAASTKAGNFGAYQLNGFVTTGLGDKVRVKANTTFNTYDGDLAYADKSVSDKNLDREKTWYANAALEADIHEQGTLSFAMLHDNRKYGYGYADAVSALSQLNQGPRPDHIHHDTFTDQKIRSLSYKLGYQHSFNNSEFELTGSARNQEYKGHFDCDLTDQPVPAYFIDGIDCKVDVEHQEYNLEARWQYTAETTKLLLGSYFEQLDTTNHHNGQFARIKGQLSPMLDSQGKMRGRTLAAFGQNIWQFAPRWQLVLGGRLQRIKKTADFNNPTMMGVVHYNGQKTDNVFLPKAALSWQFHQQQSTYLSYNRGYLPGGYNHISNTPEIAQAEFDAQTSDEIELGYKLQRDQLMLTMNLFYMDIKDIQSMHYTPAGEFMAVNIDGATSQGAELEGHWDINDYFRLDGGFAWVDATYNDGAKHQGVNVGGKYVEYTPKTSGNLGLNVWYNNWSARVGMRHTGEKYIDAQNTGNTDDHQIWNANLGYMADQWSARLWVDNLTDEFAVNHAYAAANSYARALIRPRQFGITFNAEF